ncbi:MAG: hypothetical protein AAGI30_10800 [Planctomycetota bacterium]
MYAPSFVGLACVVLAAGSQAAVIDISAGDKTIADLLGNSFIVDDKQFDIEFYASATVFPGELFIVPVDFGLFGRGFDLLFELADRPGDFMMTGFTLEYDVTVIHPDPGYLIVDNILQFNGFAAVDGSIAEVNETVIDGVTGALVGEKTVFADGGLPRETWRLEDRLEFDGVRSLNIVKDFLLFAPQQNGVADASFIRQTFSQVPSPGTVALLGIAGVSVVRRRRA